MNNYFATCATLEDVKAEFKTLCLQLQGDPDALAAMHADFTAAFTRLSSVHASPAGGSYIKPTSETPNEFAAAVAPLVDLPGLHIELCGRWIWITGDTYTHKEAIKAAGYRWAKKKCAWYWHPADEVVKNRRPMSLQGIRGRHGCQVLADTVEA